MPEEMTSSMSFYLVLARITQLTIVLIYWVPYSAFVIGCTYHITYNLFIGILTVIIFAGAIEI